MKDGEPLEAEAPEPRSPTADDMRPVFEAILEYAEARRDYESAGGCRPSLAWDKYMRLARAEAWFVTFADAIRGQQ